MHLKKEDIETNKQFYFGKMFLHVNEFLQFKQN